MKKSFIMYLDLCEVFTELTDEQSGVLIKEIVNYAKVNNPSEPKKPSGLSGLMNAVFTPFKNHIDRDLEKYKKVIERNINNGKKGGRPKSKTQKNPKKGDNDNDNDNDSDSDSDIKQSVYDFESFWNAYEKKGNRKTSLSRYSKINENNRELIKSKLPLYIQSTSDKQFRKNAEAWLNQECWNDEVSINTQPFSLEMQR